MNKLPLWCRMALVVAVAMGVHACSESNSSSGDSSAEGFAGRGGSTARMTIAGDFLYAIAGNFVQLFDIRTPSSPNPWARVRIDWDIQTLFPYGDYLLVGAADGVHILDNTDPAAPVHVADFRHAQAQDPVVAQNDYAYVTLKSNEIFTVEDQMNVLNIADITNPMLVDTIAMQSPSGLSIDNDRLFVCDGVAGLKVFDATNPEGLSSLEGLPDVECNDVIATDNRLYIITDASLLQYDYTTLPPVFVSEVSASGEG